MKLNDKSLTKYASSGAPPDREGYLNKRGNFHKGFQKRWCVLKGNLLFYYEKKIDKDPCGMVVLEGFTVELADHEEGFAFMLNFPGPNTRTYVMSADTQEDMEAWMKALSAASYDYLKVCVYELKKQLQDLESSGNQILVEDAVRSSAGYAHSARMSSSDSSSSNQSSVHRRHNPFNTDESVDGEFEHDRQTMVEKQARTFLQMHAEIRDQVNEITKTWLMNNPRYRPALLTHEPLS